MRLEKKIINATRETLIAKYGLVFLELPETIQKDIMLDEILKTLPKIRAQK